MGIFSKRPKPPFWRIPPIRTEDPDLLYHHGISCVGRSDGPGMLASGWALWGLVGIGAKQASDFLYTGFLEWEKSPEFTRELGCQFLDEALERLSYDLPAPWPDLYAVPPEEVEPVATYYSTRCWMAMDRIRLAGDGEREAYETQAFELIRRTRVEFVPAASMGFAKAYAQNRGLPSPW